jgi:hypothetical protein
VLGLYDDPTQGSSGTCHLLFFWFLKTKALDVKFDAEQDHSKLYYTKSYQATT